MNRTKSIALLCAFLTLLNERVGESMVFPLLAFLVAPVVDARHVGLVVGLLGGSYAMFQFLLTPVIGSLSDHLGRRPVLVICITGSALSVGLFGVGAVLGTSIADVTDWGAAAGLALMFIGRILHGVTGGTAATAQAVIVDVTPPAQRTQALGLVGVAIGLGFVIGPGAASWLMEIHLSLPIAIAIAIAIALLNLLLTLLFFSETLPIFPSSHLPIFPSSHLPIIARRPWFSLDSLNPFQNMIQTLSHPRVGHLSLGFGLFFIVLYSCVTILVPFVSVELGWQPGDVGQALPYWGWWPLLFRVFSLDR